MPYRAEPHLSFAVAIAALLAAMLGVGCGASSPAGQSTDDGGPGTPQFRGTATGELVVDGGAEAFDSGVLLFTDGGRWSMGTPIPPGISLIWDVSAVQGPTTIDLRTQSRLASAFAEIFVEGGIASVEITEGTLEFTQLEYSPGGRIAGQLRGSRNFMGFEVTVQRAEFQVVVP